MGIPLLDARAAQRGIPLLDAETRHRGEFPCWTPRHNGICTDNRMCVESHIGFVTPKRVAGLIPVFSAPKSSRASGRGQFTIIHYNSFFNAASRHRRGIGAAMPASARRCQSLRRRAPSGSIPPRAGPQARRDDEGRRGAARRGAARRRRAAGTKRSLGPALRVTHKNATTLYNTAKPFTKPCTTLKKHYH